MNENRIKRNRMLGETIIKGLESRNMEGYYVESKEEALEKALELIREKACPLSEVGWEVGIGEYKYFKHVFKKYMGLSPKQYRDRYKEKEFCSEPGMEWKDAADEKRILPLP